MDLQDKHPGHSLENTAQRWNSNHPESIRPGREMGNRGGSP